MFYQDLLKNKLLETKTTLPSILDMCYLSGKIYEDPEKDAGLQCTLPEGYEVFKNCSSLQTSWMQYLKKEENDAIRIALKAFVSAKNLIGDELTKVAINSSTLPTNVPEVSAVSSNVNNELKDDIDNKKSDIKDVKNISKESTGFKAALYINSFYNCSVLAIRGTVPTDEMTLITDAFFIFNVIPKMYDQVIKFYYTIRDLPILKQYPLVACTGHSLGGILSKMIAPITGVSTYTFNSPGVLQILRSNKYSIGLRQGQEILTFIADADPTGHLRYDNDLGTKSDHIFLPILNGKSISVGSIKTYDDVVFNGLNFNYADKFYKNSFKYHGIVDMFTFFKSSSEAKIYRTRLIKINENT